MTVHLWDHESFSYEALLSFQHPKQVQNVFPGDFTYDGTVDLLVVSKGSSSKELDMSLYVGTGRGVFGKYQPSAPYFSVTFYKLFRPVYTPNTIINFITSNSVRCRWRLEDRPPRNDHRLAVTAFVAEYVEYFQLQSTTLRTVGPQCG